MNLPKRNSADGRCYWMKPEVQEELQPLFDQCIQDAIDGRITRLDSLWPPVVVSSEGAPFEVWQLLRAWTEIQQAETLDAEKAIAFSENLRRQSRWGEIDHHLLDMLKRELQEKYIGFPLPYFSVANWQYACICSFVNTSIVLMPFSAFFGSRISKQGFLTI